MKIKYILTVAVLGLLLNTRLYAQEGLPFYEHYLVTDNYLINPSYAGSEADILKFRGTHYSQWSGIEDAPSTQTLSVHTRLTNKLAGGFYVFNDKNGATSLRGFNLSAAYHIPIGDQFGYTDKEDTNQFSFGLSYNGISQVFDRDEWQAQHPLDPYLQDDTYYLSYFNIGTNFQYNGFYGGFSVLDIPLGDNRPIVNSIEPLPTWYYLQAGYKWDIATGVQLQPSFLMNLNSNSERQIDLTLRSRFEMGANAFGIGVNYRTDTDESGAQALSLTPLINLEIGRLNLGYAYKLGLTDISKEAGDGHLISLGFDFGNPFNYEGY